MGKITDPQAVSAIIDALGGCNATARLMGVTQSAVSQWRYNGIPAARVLVLRYARPDIYAAVTAGHPRPQDDTA